MLKYPLDSRQPMYIMYALNAQYSNLCHTAVWVNTLHHQCMHPGPPTATAQAQLHATCCRCVYVIVTHGTYTQSRTHTVTQAHRHTDAAYLYMHIFYKYIEIGGPQIPCGIMAHKSYRLNKSLLGCLWQSTSATWGTLGHFHMHHTHIDMTHDTHTFNTTLCSGWCKFYEAV